MDGKAGVGVQQNWKWTETNKPNYISNERDSHTEGEISLIYEYSHVSLNNGDMFWEKHR